MNLIETYVTNITKVENIPKYSTVRIIADFDCYGNIELQTEKILHRTQYEMIKEKGYYLT